MEEKIWQPFVWTVQPEIFSFELRNFHLAPRWYGLCFAVAMLIGYQFMKYFFKERNISQRALDSGFVLFVFATIAGARLGHCLFYEPEYYLVNPLEILKVWKGGLASHGGVLGILIAMYYFTKKEGIPFLWFSDRVCIPISIGGALIRIGNFFNSEMIGHPAPEGLPWAIVFRNIDEIPRHPGQLYEAFGYLIMTAVLLLMHRFRGENPKPGRLIGVMFVGIFSIRIFVEFFKENQVDFENGMILNMGQMLSIPLVLFGLFLIFFKPEKLVESQSSIAVEKNGRNKKHKSSH